MLLFYDKDLRAWQQLSPSSRRLVKAFIWAVVFSAIGLWVIATAGCAGGSPLEPSAQMPAVTLPARLTLGCSGQSNAELLCREGSALGQIADVVGWQRGSSPIVCWDADASTPWSYPGNPPVPYASVGSCWPHLQPFLGQPMHAFVWWQGENDKNAPQGVYLGKLTALMARVRAEHRNPNLLVVIIQLAPLYNGDHVQHELKAWAQRDPNALYIPTSDLAYPDDLHMTIDFQHPGLSVGYQTVAQRIDQAVRATP